MGMKKILTAYYPWLNENLYTLTIRQVIVKSGYDVESVRNIFRNPIKFIQCKIFNLNWFENAPTWKSYYKKIIVLRLLKIFRKKVIYTMHNKQPHDLKHNKYAVKLMKKLCLQAVAIVGLCPDTLEVVQQIAPRACSKVVIIPHYNYLFHYSISDARNLKARFNFTSENLVVLFVGLLRPYKNIKLLIKIVNELKNEKIRLLIAGEPFNGEYCDELLRCAQGNPNIVFDFRYVPDDEIVSYYNTADLVVLPYHKESSLNSGVVYLSFSLKKTVICPDIGSINMIPDKRFVYSYHYDTDAEHEDALSKVFMKAVSDFETNPDILRQKGEAAYKYVSEEHSMEIVEQKYAELYKSLE